MQRQYHNSTALEKSESAPPHPIRRWQPGEPIPKGHAPNPHDALVRNAYAAEMEEQRRRFNDRRQPRTAERKEAA
jgi:hypothetical protein